MRLLASVTLGLCLLVGGCPSAPSSRGASRDAGARDAADASPLDASSDGSASSALGAAPPPDAGPDEPLPPSSSEEMTARAKHLLEAIAHDNPDLGTDMLFPRDAFLAARDSADPGKAWDAKIASQFQKGVHALHKRAKGIEKAQFVSFEIGHNVQQASPKRHEWKRPLWRVKRSRLTFTVDGKMQHVDVGEMTGWHGAWYVTRLR